ncbi:MAG TPA: hypothetical protein ENN51_00390 [candidate division WOR-3 bacterium]|uniref:PKD domain-containing protein n=1 Tax=candidate division WOR-3 bacterium TaxID=2052148 RepID=A0A7V0T3W7_UNCW3|nr:hypothetical protein [candidate division WOR-3 bacterium]
MRKNLALMAVVLAVLFIATGCRNKPPLVPVRPTGPDSVALNVEAEYTSSTTDPNRDAVRYVFDWDDDSQDTTEYLASGALVTKAHTWTEVGTYALRVKAQDERGNWSADWSDALEVNAELDFGESYYEPFDSDVFASGSWSRTDSSVWVDIHHELLRIDPNFSYNDGAQTHSAFRLPLVVECKMKLVQGGSNYLLPNIHAVSPDSAELVDITYLSSLEHGWRFDGWTGSHTRRPSSEDEWFVVKAVLRREGGELFVRPADEASFSLVVSSEWNWPSSPVHIRLRQPWDARCEFDYVKVSFTGQNQTAGEEQTADHMGSWLGPK